MDVTVVIPLFNESETLAPLIAGITDAMGPRAHRIVCIDDGSTDGSFEALCALHERYETVDVIRFRRNFGKSAALAAGFARVEDGYVITMDADLQDDPKEIPNFLRALEEGADLVCGWKERRHDPWHKTMPSRVYNAVVSRVFHLALHDINCGFKAMRNDVAHAIPMYGGMHRLIPVFAANLGYRVGEIAVEHHPRRHGVSKYGIERFTRGAIDVCTAWFLTRHGANPGYLFLKTGFTALALSAASGVGAVALWGLCGRPFKALALSVFSVGMLMGGGLSFGLGALAELSLRKHADPGGTRALIAEERMH